MHVTDVVRADARLTASTVASPPAAGVRTVRYYAMSRRSAHMRVYQKHSQFFDGPDTVGCVRKKYRRICCWVQQQVDRLTVFIILYVLESPCGCQQITAKSQFTSAMLLHVAHYDYYYYYYYYCYTRLVASFP